MKKFFNEPVDALDLRLTDLEASLTVISDPWALKAREEKQQNQLPLDYSVVEVFSKEVSDQEVTSTNDMDGDGGSLDDGKDVQFIAASSLKSFRHHPYQRTERDCTMLVSPSIVRHVSGSRPWSPHYQHQHHDGNNEVRTGSDRTDPALVNILQWSARDLLYYQQKGKNIKYTLTTDKVGQIKRIILFFFFV